MAGKSATGSTRKRDTIYPCIYPMREREAVDPRPLGKARVCFEGSGRLATHARRGTHYVPLRRRRRSGVGVAPRREPSRRRRYSDVRRSGLRSYVGVRPTLVQHPALAEYGRPRRGVPLLRRNVDPRAPAGDIVGADAVPGVAHQRVVRGRLVVVACAGVGFA